MLLTIIKVFKYYYINLLTTNYIGSVLINYFLLNTLNRTIIHGQIEQAMDDVRLVLWLV